MPIALRASRADCASLRWLTWGSGGQNISNYVALILRHGFGWPAGYSARRVRSLVQ